MSALEKWAAEFCYKLKDTKFNFSADHLVLASEELATGEYEEMDEYIKLSGDRLRQQQAEIESLKKQLDTVTRDLIGASLYEHDYKTLIAKPPLTDDEIQAVWIQCLSESTVSQLPTAEFARAILEKASEK